MTTNYPAVSVPRELPKTLVMAMERLEIMQPAQWPDFSVIGKQNTLRHLKKRGLVHDVGGKYDDEPIGPKPSKWRLTEAGVKALQDMRATKVKNENVEVNDDGVYMGDYSFDSINSYVHGNDVPFEYLQCLCLDLATKLEPLLLAAPPSEPVNPNERVTGCATECSSEPDREPGKTEGEDGDSDFDAWAANLCAPKIPEVWAWMETAWNASALNSASDRRMGELEALLKLCQDVIDDDLEGRPARHSLGNLHARIQAVLDRKELMEGRGK